MIYGSECFDIAILEVVQLLSKTISKGITRTEKIPEAENSSGFNTDVRSARANKVRD